MITITSVVGNIRSSRKLADAYQRLDKENKVERVLLSRMEAQKSRIRKVSDAGTDIAISLGQSSILKHGDVLQIDENRLIVVECEPEDVLGFTIKDGLSSEEKTAIAIKLGHIIGNLHRPIYTKGNTTYMPIQSEYEIANIKRTLLPILAYIDIHQTKIVFEPEEGIDVHTH
jgi:urease accessory protein